MYASSYSMIKDPSAADLGNVYASLKTPDDPNTYGETPPEPVYNDLEDSRPYSKTPFENGPVCIEQPVYNVLEEITTTPGNVSYRKEQVYNVLEGPDQSDAEGFSNYGFLPAS